ncbi:MAG: sigma-70 family RNA polymerase sigma factor [Planctomycetes bacterium]|nr:sigma-70 family RNA polymerase sigma factor [Planctomycetota bacterium]
MGTKAKSEADAVDAWVRETLPRAVAYARSLLRHHAAAEDVVHDCYCRLLRRADIYDLPRDGTKLLYRAITNACINRFQRDRVFLSLDAPRPDGKAVGGATIPSRESEPDERLRLSELERAIEKGMELLSVTQRAALQLKMLDHSIQDIADTLGLTTTNTGVLIHRARQTMAGELASYLGEKAG